MPGFMVGGGGPAFMDTGQGASDRLASWRAWTSGPDVMIVPETSTILRQDDNGGVIPLGQGGCGTWAPLLDGSSNGATSGGDNPFFFEGESNAPPPPVPPITDDSGNQITDEFGNVISP